MNWLWLLSYFFAGVFAANAIPHFVSGMTGRPFQSPFAKPPGKGLSSSPSTSSGDSSTRSSPICWSCESAPSIRARPPTSSRSAWARCSSASTRRITSASFMEAIRRRAHDQPDVRHLPLPRRSFNFRLWTAGALVSNVGTWMQRVAQDWLVLTQLTHHDASALGIVMGLQFAPAASLPPLDGIGRRPPQSAQAPDVHPGHYGRACSRLGSSHHRRRRPPLARVPVRLSLRLRCRAGCAGAADLRRRNGRRCGTCQMPSR